MVEKSGEKLTYVFNKITYVFHKITAEKALNLAHKLNFEQKKDAPTGL